MRRIALKSRHEAVIVRIITVIRLIFLPGTFVSESDPLPPQWQQQLMDVNKTFFSTDVIKYQNSGDGSFSNIALIRWLEVTLGLTALTTIIAVVLFLKSRNSTRRRMKELPMEGMKLDV